MRKIFKPLIALSIIAAFTLSTVLCCCAMQAVHLSSLKNRGKMASDPCQKGSSSQKTHHGYCFLQAPIADRVQLSSTAEPPLYNFVRLLQAIVAFERGVHQVSVLVWTAYGGIFLSQSQLVPLYLQTHSLRL